MQSITFQQRIQLVLPPWYGNAHPFLDAITYSLAAAYTQTDAQIEALKPLIRINTTSGEFLDMVAQDFFNLALARNNLENDTQFRVRIKQNLFAIRGTRQSFIENMTTATGYVPTVIDPREPKDTGVMGNVKLNVVPTLFYNSAGNDCYTNIHMPWQWFVKIKLPLTISVTRLYQIIDANVPGGTVTWLHVF